MKIQVLMSCCKANSIDELLKNKNIKNCIIFNQLMENNNVIKKNNKIMYNSKTYGLSKSRNELLKKMDGEIGIITDEDVTFEENYEKIVSESYQNNPNADIIIFNVKIGDKTHGRKKNHRYNIFTLLGVISIQITFRVKSIKENQIYFNENFGLKSKFKSGEENIFLNSARKKGLQIIHVPENLCFHPPVKTTGEKWDDNVIITKGAIGYAIFKQFNFIFKLYLIIFKYTYYKKEYTIYEFIKLYNKGVKEFKELGDIK